jgi:HlyD family secretion protein
MRALLCISLLAALSISGCKPRDALLQGYVEGEFLYLAAPEGGYLKSLDTPRGSRVEAGQTLFVVASDPDSDALSEAEARAGSARAKVQDLAAPRRRSEIAALQANLAATRAALQLAETRLHQQESLVAQHLTPQSSLDEARSAQQQAAAQADAAQQQLATFQASVGRRAEVRAAAAELDAALAAAAQKRWIVSRKTVRAPEVGEITDSFYRPGEWVPAGSPVVSLLPDARRRLRFFVPETLFGAIHVGQEVVASCDGCAAPIRGHIDFIAPQAEYTPPVIYSRDTRDKLVFRIEAAVAGEAAKNLHPGLPVDVRLQ